MTRCGARRTSARTDEVPRVRAGRLQRASKTPMTMMREMTIGEMPMETSFVGASAAPSQAPAAKPERMPSNWSFLEREASGTAGGVGEETTGGIFLQSEISANETKKQQSAHQDGDGHPEMDVGEDACDATRVGLICGGRRHVSVLPEIGGPVDYGGERS